MRRFPSMTALATGLCLVILTHVEAEPGNRGPESGSSAERAHSSRGRRGLAPAHSAIRIQPPQGFRGAPPDFRGRLPAPGRAAVHFRNQSHYEVHPNGRFRGRTFDHFSAPDRRLWEHGGWRHTWHDGHLGWWWVVSGSWFFYPQPIYPYPLYVGPSYYYDYYGTYGAPPYYWYYCEDPPGYYPYVPRCYVPWEPVPPGPE